MAWILDLPMPHVFAALEQNEQPSLRLSTEIINIDPEAVSIGIPVQVVFKQQEKIYLPPSETLERELVRPTFAKRNPIEQRV